MPENLLLPSTNCLLTSINFIFPGVTPHCRDIAVTTFAVLIAHTLAFFRTKNPRKNAEIAYLQVYCSPMSDMTTAGFSQVPCNFQSFYFLESWLLQAGNHSTPPSCCHWECNQLFLNSRWMYGPMKTPSLIFAALIPGNFSARYQNASSVWSIDLTKLFISLGLTCRGGSKILLNAASCGAGHFYCDCREVQCLSLFSFR